jgi:hypothetical protein
MLHSIESIEHTMRSYREAMGKVLVIAPLVETCGGGSYDTLGLPRHVRCLRAGDVSHARALSVGHEPLFEFGQPKLVQQRSWLWRDNFFKVTASVSFGYTYAEWQPARIEYSEDGERVREEPARLRESLQYAIRLDLKSRTWGMGEWDAKLPEIRAYLDGAPAEVVEGYHKAVDDATEHLNKWRAALRSVSALATADA